MFNTLNETKLFTGYKKKTNFQSKLANINIRDFYIPEELINDRIGIFKGMKDVYVSNIIEAIKSKKIIPVHFRETNKVNKTINLFDDYKYPKNVYTLQSVNDRNETCILFDLSSKGKYQKGPSNELVFYAISDIDLYDLALAAYIQYKITTDLSISTSTLFYSKISELYGLLLSKNMDSYLSISAISQADQNKLYFLTQIFCMQAMFNVDKETAIKVAIKTKFIADKGSVLDSSYYVNHSELDIMTGVDFENIFPIDKFTEVICKEFSYITPDKFNSGLMMIKWNNMYREGSMFALEHSISFINTIVYAIKGLDVVNNFVIKNQLKLISWDPLKEINSIIHK